MICSTVSVVIGSWGSYNACNERALGSKWLDLSKYTDWEEIVEELKNEGFELNGIDEELFIQDIEGIPSNTADWDYMHPERLFNVLNESGVLESTYDFEVMEAFLSVRNFDDFAELVDDNGSRWNDDIHYYKGYSWSDYGREMFDIMGYDKNTAEALEDFIDFEQYGRYMGSDYAEECEDGIIEIVR